MSLGCVVCVYLYVILQATDKTKILLQKIDETYWRKPCLKTLTLSALLCQSPVLQLECCISVRLKKAVRYPYSLKNPSCFTFGNGKRGYFHRKDFLKNYKGTGKQGSI